MVSEKLAAKTALALGFVGILLLFFVQSLPVQKSIGELQDNRQQGQIKTIAKIGWIKETENTVFFELNDGNKITARLAFPTIEQKQAIRPGEKISVVGTITGKKGKKTLVAKEVWQE